MNGVVPSSVVRCWSAPAASSVRMISIAPPPPAALAEYAATQSGVAPRRSPVPVAKPSNAPLVGWPM